ncbi:MAG: glutathione S-transferase C-terminal domain-containing protein [Rhodobiaceae bacterium]|nr:glutathione S-transferase C-terminal domain-containing protein [Rhodobiaceae bacterium]MCC0055574.1 glutathione S-transferase C-terminal domain-containing protein [Rhodobiaceae bacterium]MCC0056685.1 glutathione S-transferase C-terminal domain-containing protein [Rhodobiaceae bacterium]
MSEYTLYCFAQSGNAYKAALMLELNGLDWRPQFVDFFNGETRQPTYREINVMGEVPVLVHKDRRYSQSGVILDYLAEVTGKYGFSNDEERRDILRWTLFDNHKVSGVAGTWRFLKVIAPSADPAVIAFLEQRVKTALQVMEQHIANRDFFALQGPSIADFSLAGYIFFVEEAGLDLKKEYPAVAAWRDRLAALPGWKHPYDLMPGHPLPGRG